MIYSLGYPKLFMLLSANISREAVVDVLTVNPTRSFCNSSVAIETPGTVFVSLLISLDISGSLI